MKWTLVLVSAAAGTAGDVLMSYAMKRQGEVVSFSPRHLLHLIRRLARNPFLIASVLCNAASFASFMALLSIASLTFSVPATALSFAMKTALAKFLLNEDVGWRRWAGAALVVAGVALLSV